MEMSRTHPLHKLNPQILQSVKEINTLYYDDLLEKKSNETEAQERDKKIIFVMKYFMIPFILFIANCICIINLVCLSYIDIGQLSQVNLKWIYPLDLSVAFFFIAETIYNVQMVPGPLLPKLAKLDRIIEICNIIEIFWFFFVGQKVWVFVLMRSVRACRVKKVRKQFRIAKFYLFKFVASQQVLQQNSLIYLQNDLFNETNDDFQDDQLESFLIDSIIDFISGIFLQSAIILAFDEITGYEGFLYVEGKLDYIATMYLVIVSFSTIGYGDIYPIIAASRMFMTVLLIINITIMSNFLTRLIEQIFNQSPYVQTYEFFDHVVILGHIPDMYLVRFMSELIEFDCIQRETQNINLKEEGIKVIIVGSEEPSEAVRNMVTHYTENARFDNEVAYLKANIFQDNTYWFKQCNIQHSRIVFSFSQLQSQNPYQQDVEVAFSTRVIKQYFPQVDIFLVLQSPFKELIYHDSLFQGIIIVSSTELNESIMGNSVENTGFSSWLQHLLSIKQKVVSPNIMKKIDSDSFQLNYIKDMQQEIYAIEFNEFFVGKTFQDAAKIMFFSGFRVNDISVRNMSKGTIQQLFTNCQGDRLATLLGIETYEEDSLEKHYDIIHLKNDKVIDLSSQQEIQSNLKQHHNQTIQTEQEAPKVKKEIKILINPQNYIIKAHDIGYIICEDYQEVIMARSISSNSKLYVNYLINMEKLKYFRHESEALVNWFNLGQEKVKEESKRSIPIGKKKLSKAQSMEEKGQKHKKVRVKGIKKNVFDLTVNEYPNYPFVQHLVILGGLDNFTRIIKMLRQFSSRTVILFTEDQFNQFQWNMITSEHKNLYFCKGEFHNVNHIQQLQIPNCRSVLIMSSTSDDLFLDSDVLCLARIILEYFEQSNMLVELKDDQKIQFFKQNPLFRNEKEYNSPFLWPSFQQGSIHFSSCIYGLLSKCVYNKNWLFFTQKLLKPIEEESMGESTVLEQENRKVNCYQLTQELVDMYQYFGLLQYQLMENRPSAIAIGLIKFQVTSNYKRKIYSSILQEAFNRKINKEDIHYHHSRTESSKEFEDLQDSINTIAGRILGDRFVLTNPSVFTPLEKHDLILLLGEVNDIKGLKINRPFHGGHPRNSTIDTNQYNIPMGIIPEKEESKYQSHITDRYATEVPKFQSNMNEIREEPAYIYVIHHYYHYYYYNKQGGSPRSFVEEVDVPRLHVCQISNLGDSQFEIRSQYMFDESVNQMSFIKSRQNSLTEQPPQTVVTTETKDEDVKRKRRISNNNMNLLVSTEEVEKLISEAKSMHKKLCNADTFNYLKIAKKAEKFSNTKKRINFKKRIISSLHTKLEFLYDVQDYSELI